MSRCSAGVLLLMVMATALAFPTNVSTVLARGQHAQPDATTLLRLANVSMLSVHSVHAVGRHTSADAAAKLDVRIVTDCSSQNVGSIPIQHQAAVAGTYLQTHGTLRRIQKSYIVIGNVAGSGIGRGWQRGLDRLAPWVLMRGPFLWAIDASYARYVCPDMFRAGYIHGYLTDTRVQVLNLGQTMVGGHSVWHVREVTGFTVDLFIDSQSYLLRRLVLSGNIGTTWRIKFDYSRFNEVLHIQPPRTVRY